MSICLEFERGKMTRFEVQQAVSELMQTGGSDPEHLMEIAEMLEGSEEDDAT